MSAFDLAVGFDHATLDKGVAGLYAKPDAREKLFKRTESGKDPMVYTASIDIQAAPVFDLAPDAATKAVWPASIGPKGTKVTGPLPAVNLFVLRLPQLHVDATVAGKSVKATAKDTRAFCTLTISGAAATLTPVSLWIDESHMSVFDKKFVEHVVVKMVLSKITPLLAGLKIPPLSLSKAGITITLGQPIATIAGGKLVLAATLTGGPAVDVGGVTWPDKTAFVLLSPALIEKVANDGLRAKLIGKTFSDSGSVKGGTWDASAVIKAATVRSLPDRTKVTFQLNDFGFKAEFKPLGGPCAIGAAAGSL